MNWDDVWPQVVAGVVVAALTGITIYLHRQLVAVRRQLGAAKSLARRLKGIGLSNFYESRDDYAKFRGAPRLADYLDLARRRVLIAGYWLAQGNEMEGITADLRILLEQHRDLIITLIIVDPDSAYVGDVAKQMKLTPASVMNRARNSIEELVELRSGLAVDTQERLDIRLHASIPFASLIVIDPDDEKNGRIQFDFKPYGSPRSNSIGFEIRSTTSRVAQTLIRSSDHMLADSMPINVSRTQS